MWDMLKDYYYCILCSQLEYKGVATGGLSVWKRRQILAGATRCGFGRVVQAVSTRLATNKAHD